MDSIYYFIVAGGRGGGTIDTPACIADISMRRRTSETMSTAVAI